MGKIASALSGFAMPYEGINSPRVDAGGWN